MELFFRFCLPIQIGIIMVGCSVPSPCSFIITNIVGQCNTTQEVKDKDSITAHMVRWIPYEHDYMTAILFFFIFYFKRFCIKDGENNFSLFHIQTSKI